MIYIYIWRQCSHDVAVKKGNRMTGMSRSSQYQATIGGRRVRGGGGWSRCTQALEQVAPRLAPEQQAIK